MTDSDIVARLRAITWANMAMLGSDALCQEAADEIERLRHELDGARLAYRGAGYDRDRMRAERDEARRRLCAELLEVEGLPLGWKGKRGAEGIAERMGWDCWKGDRNEARP